MSNTESSFELGESGESERFDEPPSCVYRTSPFSSAETFE